MASEGLLVGVDFGTSACKAGIVALDGTEVAQARVPTPWRPVPTGAELDPDALVDTALRAIERALAAAPEGPVRALGVTSMAETGALLDSSGRPAAPAIAWHDDRGREGAAAIADGVGAERFSASTGLPVRPLCSASKYLWLRAHHDGATRGRRWLNVAEWIVHRLGGEQAAELSLASRTGWLELPSRTWWTESLELCGAPPGFLPEPVPSGTPLGKATAGPARLADAVLTVAGHDHLCGAVGAGALDPGTVYDSCGTAEAFVGQLAPPVDPDDVVRHVTAGITVGWHVLPDRHALLGALRAGLGLQRFLDLLGVAADERAQLDAAALAVPAGAHGMTVADVDGEAAALRGIGRTPSPAQAWRAALEAVAAQGAGILRVMESATGAPQRVVVAGGWARSDAFRAVKRERLGDFRHAAGVAEAGVRGAALLAGLAAGLYQGVDDLPRPRTRP